MNTLSGQHEWGEVEDGRGNCVALCNGGYTVPHFLPLLFRLRDCVLRNNSPQRTPKHSPNPNYKMYWTKKKVSMFVLGLPMMMVYIFS